MVTDFTNFTRFTLKDDNNDDYYETLSFIKKEKMLLRKNDIKDDNDDDDNEVLSFIND